MSTSKRLEEESRAASRAEAGEEGFAQRFLAWAGAYAILFVGFIHLMAVADHFGYAIYLGILFLANFVGATVAAAVIFWRGWSWGWLPGVAIAALSFAGFVVSRTAGLPGFPDAEETWFNLPALTALATEAAFLGLTLLALTSGGQSVVNAEQRSIEMEEEPPILEREMAEIRSRTTPGLRDLRSRASPRAVKTRTLRSVRRRLRDLLGGGRGS